MKIFIRRQFESDWVFLWFALIVVVLWFLNPFIMKWFTDTLNERGVGGDQFGAVNSLFAGLAFAGLIATLLLQRKELGLQREELQLTRAELAMTRKEHEGVKEQLAAQSETLKKQSFENTFFEMIRLHHNIVSSMTTGENYEIQGRTCFAHLESDLRSEFISHVRKNNTPRNPATDVNKYKDFINDFFKKNQHLSGYYLKNLMSTLLFVDRSQMDNRIFYVNIIKSQLSTYELVILYYFWANSTPEINRLIHEYAILEGLPEDKILIKSHKGSFYAPSAFGEQLEAQ